MGGSCITHKELRYLCTKYWSENLSGRDNSEYLGVFLGIILEWFLEKYIGSPLVA
jgi:hypothetical protein